MPRTLLAVLVLALPVLIVVFGVLMGASSLARAVGDAAGGRVLGWVAATALVLLVVDVLLLLIVLGIRALDETPPEV
jgi:hypothetical protein